ncbi:probable cation-transporting ATPase 13A4 [Pelobates fuscus]|uniref:probable cation-transporting ATPase 13A4 n=1 Tax=Pelobates fuscus TaxID=191477 RepID=UPI002FE4CD7B
MRLKEFFQNASTNEPSEADMGTGRFKTRSTFDPHSTKHTIKTFLSSTAKMSQEIFSCRSKPQYNMTKQERFLLRELSNDSTIVIRPADKGGGIVLMDYGYYSDDLKRQLMDTDTYFQLKGDPTVEIQNKLVDILDMYLRAGYINTELYHFLNKTHPRTPVIYSIPKIHKNAQRPPGRPIVSAIDGILEPIAQWLDFIFKKPVEALYTCVKDTQSLLQHLKALEFEDTNPIFITMDVSNLYTVIPHIEGVEAMRQVLCNTPFYQGPPIEAALELLLFILNHNYFRFEDQWYLQTAGTSMGSAVAPRYANAYMYMYEIQYILTPYARSIMGYYRYIDDLLIIWKGTPEQAQNMVDTLNQLPTPIRFTSNISEHSVQYLDLELSYGTNGVEYTLFSKPTDRNTLLHAQSAHPWALKKSIPKAQYQRVIRNNSNIETAEIQLRSMTQKFVNRGYEDRVLREALVQARLAPRKDKAHSSPCMVFPLTFHNSADKVTALIKDNWKMVSTDDSLPKIFKEPPMICYRRNRNLRDILDYLLSIPSASNRLLFSVTVQDYLLSIPSASNRLLLLSSSILWLGQSVTYQPTLIMEDSQNVPVDFQAMINAAFAASVEKALSKARASAPDVPKTRRRPRHESDSELSDYQTRDESRPTKRHDKGEDYAPKPPKGKAPAKRKSAKLHTPAPRQEYSSDEEQGPAQSMPVLDEWQADASESDYDAWGSDEKSVSAFMRETLLGAAQTGDIEDTADAEPPLDSDIIVDPSGQAMFNPRNIRHLRSGDWSPPEHLSRFMHLWLRKPLEKEVRSRLRSECPRPSLPDKVAQTPEFDKVMTTFMMRSGRDPRRGVEKGLWGAQDNLLDSVGPLARIMYLADDAYAKADSFSTEDIREWAHDIREWALRCFVSSETPMLRSLRRDEKQRYTVLTKKTLQNGHNGEHIQDGYTALLNEGEENEMEIFGYKTIQYRKVLSIIGCIISFGVLWLLFYWRPEWEVWICCEPCSLQEADVVLLRTTDEFKQYCRKCIKWTDLSELKLSVAALEKPIPGDSHSIINQAIIPSLLKIKCIWVQKIKYIWLNTDKRFQKAGYLEDDYSCSEMHSRFSSGLSREEQELRRRVCGPNAIEVEVTPIWKLLFKEVLNPFYVFQIASLALWLSEGYIEYSIIIIIITLISISLSVYDMRQQSVELNKLVESNNSTVVTLCMKDGAQEQVESRCLVPGDIIVLTGRRFFLPCDCILLRGSCIVNEGMLTGESIPVTKSPLENIQNSTPWKIQSGEDFKRHVLFCGTEVIQTSSFGSDNVIAVVKQTGFNTAKGDMVRSILFPKPMNFKLYQDATRFLMCLVAIAVVGFIYTVVLFSVKGETARDIIVKALIVVTVAIPPVLPAAVSVAIMYAQKRLKKKKIFCISPQRINVCGRINVVCFDKTGTLTEDGLDLWGVLPAIEKSFQNVHMFTNGNNLQWSPLLGAMACCHSLIVLDGKIQGDPLDLKMFEGTNWVLDNSCQENECDDISKQHLVIKPGPHNSSVPLEGIIILLQFPFSSSLQRMSVVAQVLGSEEKFVFMKGAPEMVTQFCLPDSVPHNFSSQLQEYTLQGFRVIGLAYKTLHEQQCNEDKDSYPREKVECDLIFLGLLILENRLKAETTPAINELNNALIRTVMITGDNLQTAITVARNSGVVPGCTMVILIEASEPNEKCPASISWSKMDSHRSEMHEMRDFDSERCEESTMYHFAMTGNTYQVIVQHFYNLLPKILLNGTIFARMSPGQKSNLVEEFQNMDYYVAMCGDGANDCGALKMAHSGISLSEQEASVASPFTSRIPNIQCVPLLIKEGRAALVASFSVFKYVTLYAMIQFMCLLLLYWELKFVGLYQYLIQDVGITIVATLTMSLTHAYPKLAPYRPPAQLISPPLLLSVIFNVLLNLAMQICGFVVLQKQPWYSKTGFSVCSPANGTLTSLHNATVSLSNGSSTEVQEFSMFENYETTTLWPITTISCIIVAFVFSKGKPFRKPIYTNYIFFFLLPIQLAACLFVLFSDFESVYRALQLVCTPTLWRVAILIILVIGFIVSYTVEETVIENRRLWLYLKKLFNYHSRSQYRVLYRTLKDDPNWPPLNKTQYATSSTEINGSAYSNTCYINDENEPVV